MEIDELLEFVRFEHKRQVELHGLKEDTKNKYLLFAKLIEEVGELSEAILKTDSLQRKDKLEKEALVEGEFADVILITMMLSDVMGVDIKQALRDKIKKIKERDY